ncbi:NADP-dependent oxidoreductase [Actinomadura craniellae]|uniref:NADP-dependent oxidoreductase n=1 Tax=Actinomadura craniellae TaxID=2231787 RepID=A0A365GW12_9ACTN|nr:NADP-dependent oxidoreductase [Actinomadura craniellae]RAY11011.1 NADP-dependent oxidoreductase [Actinomadura craniellae]
MQAIVVSGFGAVPEYVDLPEPEPGPNEILVRMHAAGYNPYDLKIVDGALKDLVEHRFPLIVGVDGAGVVEAVGEGVTRFMPGDRVYGRFQDPARGLGSYAEYSVVGVDGSVARMPEGLLFEQAAAVPTASATGFDLVEAARLDVGQRVLIVGASGGVGQAAVQFAAARGAHVIATATSDVAGFLRELGATEIVDHTAGPVPEQVLALHRDGLDAVLDMVTPPAGIEPLVNLLRPGGVIVSTIFSLNPDTLAARKIRGINLLSEPDAARLASLADLFDAGRLKIRLEALVPFQEAVDMLRNVHRHKARGKTVIEIASS